MLSSSDGGVLQKSSVNIVSEQLYNQFKEKSRKYIQQIQAKAKRQAIIKTGEVAVKEASPVRETPGNEILVQGGTPVKVP